MTEKIFWEDPYLTSLDTIITSVRGEEVTVEQTIFYALSGGQESDSGTIENQIVITALKDEKEIKYTLEKDHGLKVGDKVNIKIDWKRRYRLMRLHFAAELVLELVYKQLKGIEKIGAHISENKARIDFFWEENISSQLANIHQDVVALLKSNKEINSGFSNEASERRYWKIDGFAQVPCGGTHLKNTNEVGDILLKRNNIGKGKERIEIRLNN